MLHTATQVVSFEKTSSPELDKALNEVREGIILPAYIPHHQRKKLHRAKYEQTLKTDPVILEIDGEIKRYRYSDPTKSSSSNTSQALQNCLNLMRTPEDFANLPALFTGLVKVADRRLRWDDRPRMVRLAGKAGSADVVLRMAKHAKQTGFILDQPETVSWMLAAFQGPAIESDYVKEKTETALQKTEHLIELLEQDIHKQPTKHMRKYAELRHIEFHLDPLFLGPRLHMAAMLALKHNEGKDVDGKVFKYARQMAAAWPAGKGMLELHHPEAYKERPVLFWLTYPKTFLIHVVPIWKGLQAAATVVDGELSAQLKARAANVEAEIKKASSVTQAVNIGEARDKFLLSMGMK